MFRERASARRIVAWNAAGSVAYALTSFAMLMVVVRLCGADEGGVFSLGVAISQLMLTVGAFEAANYCATDAEGQYSYGQYLGFKLVTCAVMAAASAAYVSCFGLGPHKAAVAASLCGFRLVDALSQYWYGAFQREGRLDLSGFSNLWRTVLSVLAFSAVLAATHDIVAATNTASCAALIWVLAYSIPRFRNLGYMPAPDCGITAIRRLFIACLPMFLGTFLAAYLANVGKYAIEAVGTDEMQAIFNVLFMPAFAINLFMGFFLKPALTPMAQDWADGNVGGLVKMLTRLFAINAAVTVLGIAICAAVGIPILELVFGLRLDGQVGSLVVLMLGGGLLSGANVVYYALVVVRRQQLVLAGYAAAIVFAIAVSNGLVSALGVLGAAVSYAASAFVLLGVNAIGLAVVMQMSRRRD